MKKTTHTQFFPNIKDYLEEISFDEVIDLKNLEELILKIRSFTGLPKDSIRIILEILFKEIRSKVVSNNKIYLKNLGSFYLSKKSSIIFRASKYLKNKVNIND